MAQDCAEKKSPLKKSPLKKSPQKSFKKITAKLISSLTKIHRYQIIQRLKIRAL